MLDNKELEQTVANLAKTQRAVDVVLIIVNEHGRAEVCAVSRRDIEPAYQRTDLAKMLRDIAEETESGGGLPVGSDGQRHGR